MNCSGELNPMGSPTESSRVAACMSMGLPHLIVALGAPGRARWDVRVGPAAARVTLKLSLRAKQPRRSGSQLWRLADARVKSRGLSNPRCMRSLTGTPRSGGDELREPVL